MKKYIQYIICGLVLASLLMFISCKRSDVTDPAMDNNVGFIINLSGVANPGLLFVSQGTSPAVSYLTATALYNDGTPVTGKNIVFKISDDIGYFPGGTRTAVRTTNAQGVTSIQYSVTHLAIDKIGADSMIYIQAWMQVDLYNVWDIIPLQLVTNMPDDGANHLAVTLINTGVIPTAIDSAGETLFYLFYNSKGTDTISYIMTVDDDTMFTTPGAWPVSGTCGATGTQVQFTINANPSPGTPRIATITITATAPSDVFNETVQIVITQN